MRSWRAFWRLSGFERGIVFESGAGLIATWVGLRVFGFRRWKQLLAWLSPVEAASAEPVPTEALVVARCIARTEELTARHLFYQPNCLEESLVLWWLLRLRSIQSEVRVGGRKARDRFEAHAWIECDGSVLSSDGEGHLHFVPFDGPLTNMENPVH